MSIQVTKTLINYGQKDLAGCGPEVNREIDTGNSSKNNVSSIERATQSACENA